MTALPNFADFVAMTGPAYFTSPDRLLNEAVQQSYILPRFLKGKDMDRVIQGGDRILDDVMFDDASTFQNYDPNEEFTWSQPQVVTEQALDWRHSLDHMSWTDHEVLRNAPSSMSRDRAKVQYKRLKKKIEQRCFTSIVNGMEDKLWQSPFDKSGQMETNTGKEQMSIPAVISDDPTNYHAGSSGNWTTIMGINPANERRWRNQRATYDFDDPDDTDGDNDGLFDAFDTMWLSTGFIPPTGVGEEYFEALTRSQFIACSHAGLNMYKRLLRASNDTLVSKQDPAYGSPQYGGIDLVHVTQLNAGSSANGGKGHIFDRHTTDGSYTTEAYDEDGNDSSGTAEANAVDGHRYWWINGTYCTPVYHSERYFWRKPPYTLERQPFTYVAPVDTWWNIFWSSRQRMGIVSPQ